MSILTAFLITTFFFALVFAGMIWLSIYFYRQWKDSQKPRIKPFLNKIEMDKIVSTIGKMSMEERFVMLQHLLGSCKILCQVDSRGITLEAAGKVDELGDHSPIDYTG